MTRLEILQQTLQEECAQGYSGRWVPIMAYDILTRNSITFPKFAQAVHPLLDKGRGKYRNVYIKGLTNCGKTFILNPWTSSTRNPSILPRQHSRGRKQKMRKLYFWMISVGYLRLYPGMTSCCWKVNWSISLRWNLILWRMSLFRVMCQYFVQPKN